MRNKERIDHKYLVNQMLKKLKKQNWMIKNLFKWLKIIIVGIQNQVIRKYDEN